MPKYRKKSDIKVLVEAFARLPPFVTAPLALISYVVFDQIIRMDVTHPSVSTMQDTTAQMQSTLVWTFLKGWSYALRILAPMILGFSIVLWFMAQIQKRRDEGRFARIAASPLHTSLHEMSWQEFERLAGRAFQELGYDVQHTGRAGADGGIDLILRRGSETALVQCKHWKATKVSVDKVRELFGLMAERGAAQGYLVSVGGYTRDAGRFASGKNISLITGRQLHHIIQSGRLSVPDQPPAKIEAAMNCPACSGGMVERMARTGARAGERFLGCARYPVCKGTRQG